jgi:hypothetical protein
MRSGQRSAGALGVVALLGTLAVTSQGTAQAATGACPGKTGVTVVVDFGSLGGGIKTACAAGDPVSGVAALQKAGFTLAGTKRYGLAFICRINNKPTPAQDACVLTPPATRYWSYWHAPRKGKWTYSTKGAASYNPAQNTVEGWAFGAGAKPRITAP